MKALIQVVKNCTLKVESKLVGEIDYGILVFLGLRHGDTMEEVKYVYEKVVNLRIFEDENGKMNLSVMEVKGKIMLVSQFTLYGDTQKGRRPSYDSAMKPEEAKVLFEKAENYFKTHYNGEVALGVFGGDMHISYTNLGPRSFIVEK